MPWGWCTTNREGGNRHRGQTEFPVTLLSPRDHNGGDPVPRRQTRGQGKGRATPSSTPTGTGSRTQRSFEVKGTSSDGLSAPPGLRPVGDLLPPPASAGSPCSVSYPLRPHLRVAP